MDFSKKNMRNRIKSWDGRSISRSGIVLLVKFVSQSLPVYAMIVFLLSLDITREIEKCLTKFWWKTAKTQMTNKSTLCWMAWNRMARHISIGGLGFKNFREYNISMLGKQYWQFIINPNSLVSRFYKARYFTGTDFINSTLGYNFWDTTWVSFGAV